MGTFKDFSSKTEGVSTEQYRNTNNWCISVPHTRFFVHVATASTGLCPSLLCTVKCKCSSNQKYRRGFLKGGGLHSSRVCPLRSSGSGNGTGKISPISWLFLRFSGGGEGHHGANHLHFLRLVCLVTPFIVVFLCFFRKIAVVGKSCACFSH